ncbi:MAG TPA: hypothetical protein VH877_06455 [Polyangia bacterium]|nr:hypothetical protein [Polyangia bacterium]
MQFEPDQLDEVDRARLQAIDEVGTAVRSALLGASQKVDVWSGMAQRLAAVDEARQKQTTLRRWRSRARRGLALLVPAVAAAGMLLWIRSTDPRVTNDCDIELLDVSGATATVMEVPDASGQGATTVIWMTEEAR